MWGWKCYTWRSIMQGLEVLKEGVIWRIGNGQRVGIWSDPWLPRGVTRKPITPRGSTLLQSVHELIDPISEQWDEQLLAQSFWDEDVSLIKALPIHLDMPDIVGWHYDSKGRFSVKSAYMLAIRKRVH